MGCDDEILQDLPLRRLHERVIDLDAFHLALAGEFDGDEAAARRALDLDLVELGLHRLHLGLEFSGLLHQSQEIRHRSLLLRRPAQLNSSTQRSSSASSGRSLCGNCAPNAEPSSSGGSSGAASSEPPGDSSWGKAAAPLRTSTISAPGKRASTACTSGSARTPVLSSPCRATFCHRTLG